MKSIITLCVFGILLSACTISSNQTTKMHITDLVQSDVFSVLPESSMEILVYQKSEEIEGEYLELARVEIEEIKDSGTEDEILEKLKKETKDLGGNGILIMESTTKSEKGNTVRKVKAIAVYALDRFPEGTELVTL